MERVVVLVAAVWSWHHMSTVVFCKAFPLVRWRAPVLRPVGMQLHVSLVLSWICRAPVLVDWRWLFVVEPLNGVGFKHWRT